MKRTSVIAVVTVLAVLFGCATQTAWTPEAKLLASRDAFNSTVNALSTAIEAGAFSADESRQILASARLGAQLLDQIDTAVEQDQPTSELIRQFNQILRELTAYREAADRRTATQGGASDGTD